MAHGYLIPTGGFVVEVWTWRDVAPVTADATLFSQSTQGLVGGGGSANEGKQFWVGMAPTTGAFTVKFWQESSGAELVSYVDPDPQNYPDDDAWHHWAVRLGANLTSLTIFLDGVQHGTATLSAAPVWNPGRLTIGAVYAPHRGVYGKVLWDKKLAYASAYNLELTANRIQEHYTAGSGGTVYYGDDEVERLNRIFTWAGVPEHQRRLEPAVTTVQGIQVAGANPLEEAQKTAEAAQGLMFADGQGFAVYHNRRHRYNRHSSATLAESLGAAPEVGLKFTTSERWIVNDVRGRRPYGTEIRMVSQQSQNEYGKRVTSFELAITDQEELRNAVSWMLARYGTDRIRVSGMTLHAHTSEILRELAEGAIEIGDVITLDELPDTSPVSSIDFVVEQIGIDADFVNKEWIVPLELTPVDVNRVFEIGVTELGDGSYISF